GADACGIRARVSFIHQEFRAKPTGDLRSKRAFCCVHNRPVREQSSYETCELREVLCSGARETGGHAGCTRRLWRSCTVSKDRLNHASPDREPNEQEEFDELQESQEAVDLPDRAAMSVINPGIVGGAGPV